MNCIETKVFRFFEEHIDPARPLMLGLSGGPDSRCLLHLFLKWRKGRSIELHLAHVNHGWRKESFDELDQLKQIANELSLPLHVATLDPSVYKGNLEAESRRARLAFFDSMIQKTQSQAIMLGHHADDLAETVLKRLLEGTGLPFLSCMSSKANVGGLTILRPLLKVYKEEVLNWLKKHGISYFNDTTNSDERFLRARMRETIFPTLRASFGKEFEENLCNIAAEAELLRHYLNERVEPIQSLGLTGPFGTFHDLSSLPLKKIELLHLLKVVARGTSFSRVQLYTACDFLLTLTANKQIMTKNALIVCDRGRAFFMPHDEEVQKEEIELKEGTYPFGKWQVTVRRGRAELKNHFRDAWKGRLQTVVEDGSYKLTFASSSMLRFVHDDKIVPISRYLNEKKVPNFLMRFIPMLSNGAHIIEDFLSGAASKSKKIYNDSLIVTLNFKVRS